MHRIGRGPFLSCCASAQRKSAVYGGAPSTAAHDETSRIRNGISLPRRAKAAATARVTYATEHPDGTIAISDDDHQSADVRADAALTTPNPLAVYAEIARQIADAGVKEVTGDVVMEATRIRELSISLIAISQFQEFRKFTYR